MGRRSIIRIGPAADENLVRIANVVVDTYRHMGMLGIGAIFGSKKRKAIVISGTEHAETLDPKKYREAYNKIHTTAVQTGATRSNMTHGPP